MLKRNYNKGEIVGIYLSHHVRDFKSSLDAMGLVENVDYERLPSPCYLLSDEPMRSGNFDATSGSKDIKIKPENIPRHLVGEFEYDRRVTSGGAWLPELRGITNVNVSGSGGVKQSEIQATINGGTGGTFKVSIEDGYANNSALEVPFVSVTFFHFLRDIEVDDKKFNRVMLEINEIKDLYSSLNSKDFKLKEEIDRVEVSIADNVDHLERKIKYIDNKVKDMQASLPDMSKLESIEQIVLDINRQLSDITKVDWQSIIGLSTLVATQAAVLTKIGKLVKIINAKLGF